MSTEVMTLRGTLEHHKGWITQVSCSPVHPDMLISASRDKTLLVWQLTGKDSNKNVPYGVPLRSLKGHSHFVSDVVISSCGAFAVSGSWDKTLRLWDIERGITSTVFKGHKHDVMSVAFSADNRQIISSSRDKTIRLWNTLGECKWVQESSTSGNKSHTEWVSTVQFSPTTNNPVIVSGGWDAKVKVWHLSNFHLKSNFDGHNSQVNSVTVSPDGSLAASGGKDGTAKLWDLGEAATNPLHSLDAEQEISKLVFSPNRYWLCAAAGSTVKIWDLELKQLVEELKVEVSENGEPPKCTCLCWSQDGMTLFTGYDDNVIRVWELQSTPQNVAPGIGIQD